MYNCHMTALYKVSGALALLLFIAKTRPCKFCKCSQEQHSLCQFWVQSVYKPSVSKRANSTKRKQKGKGMHLRSEARHFWRGAGVVGGRKVSLSSSRRPLSQGVGRCVRQGVRQVLDEGVQHFSLQLFTARQLLHLCRRVPRLSCYGQARCL